MESSISPLFLPLFYLNGVTDVSHLLHEYKGDTAFVQEGEFRERTRIKKVVVPTGGTIKFGDESVVDLLVTGPGASVKFANKCIVHTYVYVGQSALNNGSFFILEDENRISTEQFGLQVKEILSLLS